MRVWRYVTEHRERRVERRNLRRLLRYMELTKSEAGLPPMTASWNLVCDLHPSTHYAQAGQPTDPGSHRGMPCMVDGCEGRYRPRVPEDALRWTTQVTR